MAESGGVVVRPAGGVRRLFDGLFWTVPPKWLKEVANGDTHRKKLNTLNNIGAFAGAVLLAAVAALWLSGRNEGTLFLIITSVIIPISSTVYAFVVVERTTFNAATLGPQEEQTRLRHFFFAGAHLHGAPPPIKLYLPQFPYPTDKSAAIYAEFAADSEYTGDKLHPPTYAVSVGRFSECAALRDVQAASAIISSMDYYFGQSVLIETPVNRQRNLPRGARLNICVGLFSNQYFLNVLNKLPSGPIIRWEKSDDEIIATIVLREDPENVIAFTRFGDNNQVMSSSHASSIDIALIVRWREPGTDRVWLCLGGFRDVGTHAVGQYLADRFVQRVLQSGIDTQIENLYWEIVEIRGVDDNPLVDSRLATSMDVNL